MKTGEVIRLIIGTIVIIAAAYYCTYWLANRKLRSVAGRGIRVRERFSLSKDKLLCTIEVQGKVYLLALTNGGATLIDTYDAEEFEKSEAYSPPVSQFEPQGVAQKAIFSLFNAARTARGARSAQGAAKSRRPGDADFSDVLEASRKNDENNPLGEERREE